MTDDVVFNIVKEERNASVACCSTPGGVNLDDAGDKPLPLEHRDDKGHHWDARWLPIL